MKLCNSGIIFIYFFSFNMHIHSRTVGIKWKYIDTGIYKIIFPEEITPAGKRMAGSYDAL
jgi:hypothetical protein